MNCRPSTPISDAAVLLMRSRGITYDESWLLLKRQPALVQTVNESPRTSGHPKAAVMEAIGLFVNSTLSLKEAGNA